MKEVIFPFLLRKIRESSKELGKDYYSFTKHPFIAMNIIQIWNNRYAWDIRIEKFSRTLLENGHNMHLLCNNLVDAKKSDEFPGLRIHTISKRKGKHLNAALSFPLSPFWVYSACQLIKKYNIECIIIRDLPLMFCGIAIKFISKIPVIFDMAENYSAMWREITDRSGFKIYNYILRNVVLAEVLEKIAIKHADHTIAVVEESRDRILEKGIPKNKVTIVGNTPDLTRFTDQSANNKENSFNDRFRLVYTGFVDSGRGLDTVIKALPHAREKIANILLIVAGGGDLKALNDLKKLSVSLGVEGHVHFTGWISHDQILPFIINSDVCIVPHNATPQINSTIPNKLFDYMYFSKPVIVSDAAPLKRIVNETNCGLIFKSRDPQDLTEKLFTLMDPPKRHKFGEQGHNGILSKYNWGYESNNLLNIFRNLAK